MRYVPNNQKLLLPPRLGRLSPPALQIDNYEKALAAHRVQNKLVMDALQALNATSGANQTAIAALHTFASGNLATPKDPQNWRFWRPLSLGF